MLMVRQRRTDIPQGDQVTHRRNGPAITGLLRLAPGRHRFQQRANGANDSHPRLPAPHDSRPNSHHEGGRQPRL